MPQGVYKQETSPTEFHIHPLELRNRTQAHGAVGLYLGLPRAKEEVDPYPEWLVFRFGAFPLILEPDRKPGEEWPLVGVACKRRLEEVRVRLDWRAHSAEEPRVRKLIDSFHTARVNDVE